VTIGTDTSRKNLTVYGGDIKLIGSTSVGAFNDSKNLAVYGTIDVNNINCRTDGSSSTNLRTLKWSGTYCKVDFTNAQQTGIRA
jgi:hypothetical protein